MTYAAAPPPAGELSIGRVFSRAFELLFGNLVSFLALTAIVWLPMLIYQLIFQRSIAAAAAEGRVSFAQAITTLLQLILAVLSEAAVLYGAFQQMRGRPFSVGESLQKGLSRLGPIVGLALIRGIGIGLGLVLLLVPGIILATMWFVALPACVLENAGPVNALSRSSALTQGARWKIVGIALVIGISVVLAAAVIQIVLAVILGWIGLVIGNYIVYVLVYAFEAVVVAVLYHDLRVAKEGIDIDRIAAVFD